MTFEDNLHMNQFLNFINEDAPGDKIMKCEATFSDTSKLRIIMMENNVSVNKSRRPKTWDDHSSIAASSIAGDDAESAELASAQSLADIMSNVHIEQQMSEKP
jgi:hypothetical protein